MIFIAEVEKLRNSESRFQVRMRYIGIDTLFDFTLSVSLPCNEKIPNNLYHHAWCNNFGFL